VELIVANAEGLAEVWVFEKPLLNLFSVVVKVKQIRTFSKAHIFANLC
jgi:hypothetical protein